MCLVGTMSRVGRGQAFGGVHVPEVVPAEKGARRAGQDLERGQPHVGQAERTGQT